ncbi:MAG TPA: hypothetical protein VFP80_00185, partial [Thermoanaerobaculia bacterium]|nr:hypothetical protein [Thermoanaerobaculia bacterium]
DARVHSRVNRRQALLAATRFTRSKRSSGGSGTLEVRRPGPPSCIDRGISMTLSDLTQQKIDELASEYRRNGYAVWIHPAAHELPEFLREFEPDLIATSPQGNVVVEVKTSSAVAADQMTRLAEAVERQSGWRFEVVFAINRSRQRSHPRSRWSEQNK